MSVKDYFDMMFSKGGKPSPADVKRAEFIRDQIPDNTRTILEVGCGTGTVTRALTENYKVTGLELSSVGVQKVRELGITCVQGSIDELPFPDKSFDMVIASEVLEHLDEEIFTKGLRQLARVASRYILITVPNNERLQSYRKECPMCRSMFVPWGHIRSFRIETLRELFDDLNFVPMKIRTFGPRIPNRHNLISRLLMWHRWLYNPLGPGQRCPICKYVVPGTPPHGIPTLERLLERPLVECTHILDFIAAKLSPKYQRWILAIYKRQ